MQGAQGGARVGAEAVGEGTGEARVGGERLGGAPGVAQGAQAQQVEGFVEGVGAAQGGERGQRLLGVAEVEGRGPAGGTGRAQPFRPVAGLRLRLGQVGERRLGPQGERLVEEPGGACGLPGVERGPSLVGEPPEAVQVDGVGRDVEPVPGGLGDDRAGPERPAQPSDERLQRRLRLGGRIGAPHLVGEHGRGHAPPGPYGEHGEQRAQPRPAEGNGAAVGTESGGGAEDAVEHGTHCVRHSLRREGRAATRGASRGQGAGGSTVSTSARTPVSRGRDRNRWGKWHVGGVVRPWGVPAS
ncbi:hypothetical protein GA0115252_10424 [Streptomyces sp. DfronAA-171]|nr:hypothetical protein GA0115252_10424 [Streptomyces sp. DfronAA-171]